MSGTDAVGQLVAQVERGRELLERVVGEYSRFVEGDLVVLGRKNTTAIVVAELMVDYYTCAETVFFRVSQFSGNDLDESRWHADLLEEMVLRIEGVRDPVIGEETAQYLGELLRFRHFRRNYFELEYDWDKLDYLQKVYTKVAERLPCDLAAFQSFLGRLRQLEGGSA